jgi:hypothetical protein
MLLASPAAAQTIYIQPPPTPTPTPTIVPPSPPPTPTPTPTPTPSPTPTPGGFDYRPNFNNLPAGSFGMAQQKTVFTDPSIVSQENWDNKGNRMFIATSGCKTAGNHCLRYFYPKGTIGGAWNTGAWGILGFWIAHKWTDVLNIEYDWMFEPGFDLTGLGGKIGPFIGYMNKSTWQGYLQIIQWRSDGAKASLVPCTQSPAGATLCAAFGKEPIPINQTGHWYHIKQQIAYGPNGYQKTWIDGNLIWNNGPFVPHSDVGLAPVIDFGSWFGGGGTLPAAKNDSWSRIDNVRIWSGTGN